MQTTTNYQLKKIELTDSPPDITVINPNWDQVDSELKKLNDNKVDKVTGKQLSTEDYTTAEKNKLKDIATGAEVNQNAFANVKVGATTIAADLKTDTLEIVAGSNITLTPDATNDKLTIAATTPKASQTEAESGTDDTKFMTPLKTKQAIQKLAPTPSTTSLTITDSGGYYTSDNVEGALQELGQALNGVNGNIIASVNQLITM